MKKVSLDQYRTEGVGVFLGRGRGKKVAEAIKKEHGDNVQITVPSDVFHIGRGFRAEFNKVLPKVDIPQVSPR